jgi:nitrite reductase/ring-hydroxylating ferredoxin subunit
VSREVARIPFDALTDLGDRVRFEYDPPLGEEPVEAVVIRLDGGPVAFQNVCPHLGMALDCHTGEFVSDEGMLLVCDAHGARFEPDSGLCTMGPCEGDRLGTLRLSRDESAGEWVVVRGRGISM